MLKLYHNAVSTCSQKVRLVLASKGIEFESEVLDLIAGGQHEPDYVKLNPNHVVPTIEDNGSVLIESTLINEYLNDAYPQNPMLPDHPAARHAARLWPKRIDEKVHPSTGIVTFAIGPRSAILKQPEDVREANINAIPEPARRAARRSVIEHGVHAPEFGAALAAMVDLLDKMDIALNNASWLTGETFGLADAAALPYVLRLDHLAMTPIIDARANLADWFSRVQGLAAYEVAVTNLLPPPLVDMFHSNGEAVWDDVQKIIAS
jgi:glutathione S-transferase